jgi:glucokinase
MAVKLAGIDLGGTNIKVGLFGRDFELTGKQSVPTSTGSAGELVDLMAAACRDLSDRTGGGRLKAVGVGAPGPMDRTKGVIIASPNIPSFRDLPLKDMLSERLGGVNVVLENDANAACWGEFICGAGRDAGDMVFFTLGTGIGGAIIIDGKLIHGCGDNAAELGHTIIHPGGRPCGCGQSGCVEAYASASSTARRAREAVESGESSSLSEVLRRDGEITCRDVYEHLGRGDTLARRITDQTAEALAILCINILHTVEPERIVFAGGMIAAGEVLLKRIKHYFEKNIWKMKAENVEICFANLGEDAGITGAAALAKGMA